MSDIKRSVTIARHRTSVTLEPEFWSALKEIAVAEGLSTNALIARIDAERLAPGTTQANLSRAIRLFILRHYRKAATDNARSTEHRAID